MDDETNEMQAILREQNCDASRRLTTSGVIHALNVTVDATRVMTLWQGSPARPMSAVKPHLPTYRRLLTGKWD